MALIGYRNSLLYIQRRRDKILRKHRTYARVYMDDFVIFSRTLVEYIKHLYTIFTDLEELDITLEPKKTFIGYPAITLLGQRVDTLGLTTAAEKLKALRNINFPRSLHDLKRYLRLTGYLRRYIVYYTQLAEPIQVKKATRLCKAPRAGHAHKNFAKTSEIDPTTELLHLFKAIQKAFAREATLVHYNPKRQL
jgi:hypothetical protein